MIQTKTNYLFNWLQRENYKSFYLAFLRVAVCVWLLKEVVITWSSFDLLYGVSVFTKSGPTIINRLPGGYAFIYAHYTWFITGYILVILLYTFGIGRWIIALMAFVMVFILQKMNTSFYNNGDFMVRQLLLYLIFANSYHYFVFKKPHSHREDKRLMGNLLSNLAAVSIMLQLCLAYFGSGLAKLIDPLWFNGEATYYALHMERFRGTPLNEFIAQFKWFDIASNYAVIIFELFFPVLIWIKKLRKPLLIAGVFFHLSIYIFLMIYGFQVIFVLVYGMFLPNQKLIVLFEQFRGKYQRIPTN